MELGEGEAQICRLCGQYESIYIDVFSEEGTKRLLGRKIHSKINILIDERDPLPKAICVQCLGKLEFVCDFQEECLRTQQVLRDRYNLPPLTEIAEVKTEETAPSTSTNNNNNDIDKNLNTPAKESVKEVAQRVSKTTAKTQRNLRSQHQANSHNNGSGNSDGNGSSNSNSNSNSNNNGNTIGNEAAKNQTTAESTTESNTDNIEIVQSTETTSTRWLRSRQNTETTSTNGTTTDTPIANRRLRSHGNTVAEISASSPRSHFSETSGKQQDPNTIQIPTSALNKLLTIVSNSPNIEVSAKESRNQSNDTEDISFTVELCKKESDDVATVRARVFPDQGSCLVDESIVGLLQNQSCVEVNSIINTIINSSLKNGNSTKSKDSAEFEQKWQASQNPEELFKIDGEEIRVDDNVEHIVTNDQNGYSCKLCCKFYERKDKCMVHVKTHLGIKQYTCILCNAKFVCKSDVMKHIRCSHTNPRPIQCPKCPKRFKSKFYLMEHDNVHKGVRPYSCTDCGQSYHHKVSLQIHMKSHLPPQNLACEYCGKVFPYRTRLLSHIASVHLKNRRNFRCRFCYNLYSSLSVLNEHIKTRHATTYTCEVCSKTFKVASKYKAHVLQHTNPKPFVCNVCNNRYASKAFLNEHLLKHEGLRKHICQKCGARFAQASHLAAHRHVHGEKKHACPECGRKFNRRDNMKIKENDGLPHVVCLRCIGALEFLCDFYSCCQHTQTKLSLSEEASKYLAESTPRRIQQHENDAESDKENVLPSSNNETKRRGKVSSPSKKDRATNDLRPDAQTILQGNASDDRSEQSATNNGIVQEQKSTDQRCNDNVLTRGNPISTRDISKKGIARASGSGFLNSFVFPMKKGESSDRVDSTKPNRRGKGRRTQLQKLREAGVTLNRTRESRRGSDESERDGNQRKRQCLRTICTNGASNVTKKAVILSKPQIELPSENKIATISSNKNYIKNDDANDNDLIGGGTAEVNLKDERLNEEGGKEESSAKSKAISVIVKQEKVDVEAISHEPGKTNQFVWIPNEILTEGQNDPTIDQDQEIELDLTLRLSPGLEDDMENSDVADADADADAVTARTDSDNRDDSEQPKTNPSFVEQTRATVIKSSREGPAPVAVKPDVTNDIDRIDGIVEGTENDSKCDLQFPPRGLVGRDSCSSEESKNKDRSFAKISELISEEQKEEIETYYKIDMSIVNSEEVEKNLTVVDKKNIRCNICGSLYLRMDKCQVHIWGHLQMKPFQCKACDFATVTVSNVRCHIRKSHLKIKPFACDLCGKRYVTAGLLEQHINGHTGARPFKCKICDFASSTRQMLSYHSSTHKPIKDINCKICGKEFYSRGKLRTHMIVHKKDKVFVCKLCSAHLSNAEALETHHKNLHTQDYVCNVCGKRMKSKKALNNHQNVHSTGKYKCSLCTNVYKSSQILKEHLLKHEGIRKYKCSVCGKTFGQQSHLAAHMAVHSGIRFHCPGCDKSFNRHDNMKIHTKRCKQFLANPQLKNLLVKKERSWSIGKVTKSTEDTTSKDSSSLNFESLFEKQTDNEESSIKTVDEKQEETAMKLGLNISCIESPDKTWTRDNVYREEEIRDLTGSGEFGAIQITETNDTFNFENDNVRILEIL